MPTTPTKPTAAELNVVKSWIVHKIIKWARDEGHCDAVEDALTPIFGRKPTNGWRDANGYACAGYNLAGFDADGYDRRGYNRNGFGRNGFNADGFDAEGYDRHGYNAEGVNREGQSRSGLAKYLRSLSPTDRNELYRLLRHNDY